MEGAGGGVGGGGRRGTLYMALCAAPEVFPEEKMVVCLHCIRHL